MEQRVYDFVKLKIGYPQDKMLQRRTLIDNILHRDFNNPFHQPGPRVKISKKLAVDFAERYNVNNSLPKGAICKPLLQL